MAFNGSGTFIVNSAGQPVVTGTTISATVENALTADLATGLTNAICKDGQQTITANIPWSGFKITGLGTATTTGDALSYGRAGNLTTLTLSGALTYGGVTLSNAVTGTGNMVLSASPTFTGTLNASTITSTATISAGNSSVYVGALVSASAPATNYNAGPLASLAGYFMVSWNSGAGYAFLFIDATGTVYLISSSNSAGGNSSFDTTNSAASNGGNGIAIFSSGASVFVQTKNSYSGAAAVKLAQFG